MRNSDADSVERMRPHYRMTEAPNEKFDITPRKGEFLILGRKISGDSQKTGDLNFILSAVPKKSVGKGVQIWKSVYDNVIIGPTAQWVPPDFKTPDRSSYLFLIQSKAKPKAKHHEL